MEHLECDIAIIGGGFGGIAAALAAAEADKRVVITEPTDWIGGQVTSQAMASLDEHFYIETFGGTRAYNRFREGVRAVYRARYPAARQASQPPLNPGGSWASRLSFEPRVGLRVLEEMLAPHVASGSVRILHGHTPLSAMVRGGHIYDVTLGGPQGSRVNVRAEVYLDATEMGDLLVLSGAPYVTGAEAIEDTGEPHASTDGVQPQRVQSFTCCLVAEYCPGENHTIRKPYGYDYYRQAQPFSLVRRTRGGGYQRFSMFEGETPFWAYRRVFNAARLTPGSFADSSRAAHDIAVINWDGNDYYKETLLDRSPAQQARILREARRLSLSFLYWLQTEAPHDDDPGRGFPGLKLLPEAAGTVDGLAKAPYIRESRRLVGYKRVLEQDIITAGGRGARALHVSDSVGVGWYPIDLHRCAGDPIEGSETRIDYPLTLPFQIPLGAMLSPTFDNLVAVGKNISTTHITSSAYRVQPVEWAIGEAAGALAAACVSQSVRPRAIWENPARIRAFQKQLLLRGAPLAWTVDAGLDDPDFAAIQAALLETGVPEFSSRCRGLEIHPDELLSRPEGVWLVERSPRAVRNPLLRDMKKSWKTSPLGPFNAADLRAACAALDLPAPEGADYPTLRQLCQRLAQVEED